MIRELMYHDAEQILALNIMTEMGCSDLETTTATLYRLLQKIEEHHILGYEMDGKLVGYIHAQVYEMLYSPNVLLNVIAVAIHEDYQGNGIGKKLIQAIEDRAVELGFDGIRINSGNNREKAHGFYERLGYVSNRDQKRFIKIFNHVTEKVPVM